MTQRLVNLTELRKRAERAIEASNGNGSNEKSDFSSEEVHRLIEELRIYQTELEIQNQELSSAQSAISEVLERYRLLFDGLPLPAIVVDMHGFVVDFNQQADELLATHSILSLKGRSCYQMFSLDSRTTLYPVLNNRAQAGPQKVENLELSLRASGSQPNQINQINLPCDAHIIHLHDEVAVHLQNSLIVLVDKSAEKALARQQVRTQNYLDTVQTFMLALDGDGNITMINRAGCALLGYEESELIGQNWFLTCLPQPEGMEHVYPVFKQILSGEMGAAWQFENSVLCRDGARREIAWRNAYIKDEAGRLLGTLSSGEDVTEQNKIATELAQHRSHLEELVQQRTAELVQTEARASHILESSADGLYGIDVDGCITFINQAACDLLGYSPEQAIGKHAHSLFHHSKPDGSVYPIEECPTHRGLSHGQTVRNDSEVYWHADGHPVPVMYAMHPMKRAGKVIGAATSFVDMSVQRAAAQAREQALDAAENLARLRSEFLANMSHEIRTPLNGVLGFAEIGLRNSADNAKTRNAFNKILASGSRLLGVINDILDFSKIEAGKLRVEKTEVKLIELIRQTTDLMQPIVDSKNLHLLLKLAPDTPRTFIGDPLRLGQVLTNLLTNAVKFTEAGSVVLSVCREADDLVFKITDTGIGMSAQQLAQLFQPFQQADGSTTRKYGGTGLGLAISKRLLELMDGMIRVESEPGVGSAFEFRLPYFVVPPKTEAQIAASAPVPSVKPLAGISILVAEDDPINQMVLEEFLVMDGAKVVIVGDGHLAIERVKQDGGDAYDIVLMDVQMPDIGGHEATRQILKIAPHLPIIGQTAHATDEERAKCLEAGMRDHIAKPINPDQLVHLVLWHVTTQRNADTFTSTY
jgi:hypothetical protein